MSRLQSTYVSVELLLFHLLPQVLATVHKTNKQYLCRYIRKRNISPCTPTSTRSVTAHLNVSCYGKGIYRGKKKQIMDHIETESFMTAIVMGTMLLFFGLANDIHLLWSQLPHNIIELNERYEYFNILFPPDRPLMYQVLACTSFILMLMIVMYRVLISDIGFYVFCVLWDTFIPILQRQSKFFILHR